MQKFRKVYICKQCNTYHKHKGIKMGKYIRKERDSIQMTKDDPAMKLFKECKLELENRLGLKLQKKEVLKLLCELAMPKIKLIKQLLDE